MSGDTSLCQITTLSDPWLSDILFVQDMHGVIQDRELAKSMINGTYLIEVWSKESIS